MSDSYRGNGDRRSGADRRQSRPAASQASVERRTRLRRLLRPGIGIKRWLVVVFVGELLLALGGSYGVTSYLVSQRTRELGIRVALGAQRADISRAVLKSSLAVVGIGVVVGIAGAIGAGRFLSSLLFGVPPYDLLILSVAALALFLTGLLANWWPARRASRVDPMISLRSE